jgi:hypothetical protein
LASKTEPSARQDRTLVTRHIRLRDIKSMTYESYPPNFVH